MHVSNSMSQASDYEINASVVNSSLNSNVHKVLKTVSKYVLSRLNYYKLLRTFIRAGRQLNITFIMRQIFNYGSCHLKLIKHG